MGNDICILKRREMSLQSVMQTVNGRCDRRKWVSETREGIKVCSLPKKHIRSSSTAKDARLYTQYTPFKHSKKIPCTIYADEVAPNFANSTKSNLKKNLDLRLLFRCNAKEDSKKKKPHPFLRLINKSPYHNKKEETKKCKEGSLQIMVDDIRLNPKRKQERYTKYHFQESKREESRKEKHSIKRETQSKSREHKSTKDESKDHYRRDESREQYKRQQPQGYRPKREESRAKRDEQQTVKTIKREQYPEDYGLTEEEEETFGTRFPYGFDKLKLLGRGGFSLVWLGRHSKSGKQFAIKQIRTQNTHQTHIKEIWFGTMFFTLGGVPKEEYRSLKGVKNLVRMYSYQMNQSDTWIFYERCGSSLGSALYDIKAEKVYGGQKLYKIFYKPLYEQMARNRDLIVDLTREICYSLSLLAQCQIVHSDLKTENILIRTDAGMQFTEIKLIDYGSAFEFKNISQFSMATPEYMPPEILNYIIHENEGEYEEDLYQQVMNEYKNPWVVDMWSLGCVLLEIVVGVPLWMSLPLLVPGKSNAHVQKEGLFAVKGRLFPDIIQKQREVVKVLDQVLEKENYSRIVLSPTMKHIIKSMLTVDFNARISPDEVIKLLEK